MLVYCIIGILNAWISVMGWFAWYEDGNETFIYLVDHFTPIAKFLLIMIYIALWPLCLLCSVYAIIKGWH